MKKLLLLFAAISIFANVDAQDIIIKKNGDEIKSKILEVAIDNVKYKKFENIDGPTYTISKEEIFMIRYENGNKDVFNKIQETTSQKETTKDDYLRKGIHLGFHITPGAGAILVYNYKLGFGVNSGIDLNIYFNDYVGLKTGITYQNLPINYYEYYYQYDYYTGYNYYDSEVKGSVSSIGIPIKFLLTTGKKVGFYLETGFNISFPISSNLKNNYGQSATGGYESIVVAAESVYGLNVRASDLISLNFGLSGHYSFMKYFPYEKSKGVLLGLQIGILFNLTK